MAEEDTFAKYEITIRQTGPEVIPMTIRIPVRAILDNLEKLQIYRGGDERFPELRDRGIPTDLDWETAVTELMLPYAKPQVGGPMINEVKNIRIKDDVLSLDCLLSDVDWIQ